MTDTLYCECETPAMDVEHDSGCRRCGRPVNFSPAPFEYDHGLAVVAHAEQTNPCTCQRNAKARTGGALYPSLLEPEDVDPDCELHQPWMIEDPAERLHALRWWFAGRQVGWNKSAASLLEIAEEAAVVHAETSAVLAAIREAVGSPS